MRFPGFPMSLFVGAALATVLSLSCDGGTTEPTVGTVRLSVSTVSLAVNETQSVSASVRTAGGEALTGRTITWSSSSSGVASVTSSGTSATITAVSVGTATITATSEGVSASVSVTVVPRAGTLVVTTETTGEDVDSDGFQLSLTDQTVTTTPVGSNETVTFDEVPEGTASLEVSGIDPNCALQGENPRTVSILNAQTTSETFRVACLVRVATLEITPQEIEMGLADTVIVSAIARDSVGNVLTGRTVEWSVSDTSIATIEPIEGSPSGSGSAEDGASAPGRTDEPTAVTAQGRAIGKKGGNVAFSAKTGGKTAQGTSTVNNTGKITAITVTILELGAPSPGNMTVSVEGGQVLKSHGIGPNDSFVFRGLPVGGTTPDTYGVDYALVLDGIPTHCFGTGDDTDRLLYRTLYSDAPSEKATFNILCRGVEGSVKVSVSAEGNAVPQGGSVQARVQATGLETSYDQAKTVPLGGDAVFDHVPISSASVEITSIPSPCVASTTKRDVGVTAGFVSTAAFSLTCNAPTVGPTPIIGPGDRYTVVYWPEEGMEVSGKNNYAQLGVGDTQDRVTPVKNSWFDGLDIKTLFAGIDKLIATDASNRVIVTGNNAYGGNGDGTTDTKTTPTVVSGQTATQGSAGDGITGIVGTDGLVRLAGWYSYWNRYAGTPPYNRYQTLGGMPSGGYVSDLVLNRSANAFLYWLNSSGVGPNGSAEGEEGGTVYTFGYNWTGQLGDGTYTDSDTPVAVAGTYTAVTAGGQHICAITPDGTARCWGLNVNGQLGDGSNDDRSTPTAVSGGLLFAQLSGGASHTCGVTTTGEGYCWGLNDRGQLGDGTTTDSWVPVLVSGGYSFTAVAAGVSHTCGVTTDNDVLCWGSNSSGELGDGTTTDRLVPTLRLRASASVSAGGR